MSLTARQIARAMDDGFERARRSRDPLEGDGLVGIVDAMQDDESKLDRLPEWFRRQERRLARAAARRTADEFYGIPAAARGVSADDYIFLAGDWDAPAFPDDDVPPIINREEHSMANSDPMDTAPPASAQADMAAPPSPRPSTTPLYQLRQRTITAEVVAYAMGNLGRAFTLSDGMVLVEIGCQTMTLEAWRTQLEAGELEPIAPDHLAALEAFLDLVETVLVRSEAIVAESDREKERQRLEVRVVECRRELERMEAELSRLEQLEDDG